MRIAVLGCGSIGRRHLQNLRLLGQPDLVVFDPSPSIRESINREFDIDCFSDLKEIWSWQPQAVLINAPTNRHLEVALEAARHDCHLFVEKPLSHSMEGVESLCAEVERRSLVTMVGCNMRFHPGPATVKRLIAEQSVGKILSLRIQTGSYLPAWRPAQDYKKSYSASLEWGGAILDCIHELDLALWYSGPARLLCAARLAADSIGLETDGLAEILLRHENAILSSIHLNVLQRDYRRTCQVIGTDGTIYWDFAEHRVDVYATEGTLAKSIHEPGGWQTNQMYVDELSHFLTCAESNVATVNSVSDALAPLEIALAARSQRQN